MLSPAIRIGNWVWEDLNANGIEDAGEAGLGNVTVQLRQGSTVVATTISSASGEYLFSGLNPGTYTVVFLKPKGYSFSPVTNQASKVIDFATGSTDQGAFFQVRMPI